MKIKLPFQDFFYDLLTDKPGAPSIKRFIALVFSFAVVFSYVACMKSPKYLAPQWFVMYMLISIAVLLGLVTIATILAFFNKGSVANSVASNNPTPDNAAKAKDIVESAKPEDGTSTNTDTAK